MSSLVSLILRRFSFSISDAVLYPVLLVRWLCWFFAISSMLACGLCEFFSIWRLPTSWWLSLLVAGSSSYGYGLVLPVDFDYPFLRLLHLRICRLWFFRNVALICCCIVFLSILSMFSSGSSSSILSVMQFHPGALPSGDITLNTYAGDIVAHDIKIIICFVTCFDSFAWEDNYDLQKYIKKTFVFRKIVITSNIYISLRSTPFVKATLSTWYQRT